MAGTVTSAEGVGSLVGWPVRRVRRLGRWLGEASTAAGRARLMERSGFQGALFHSWLFPITRHGKLLLCAFAMTALPAGISLDVPMYEVTVGVVCLLVVTTGVGSLYRLARTTVSGSFPATVVAGEMLVGLFRVENRSRVNLYDVAIGCFRPPRALTPLSDESAWGRVGAGTGIELPVQLMSSRRGRYRLPPVRVYSLFPFGIGRTEVARLPWSSVLVLPRVPRVEFSAATGAMDVAEDASELKRGRTDATEYLGSRDYVLGDEPRMIDHRAWARSGRPVVREWGVPAQRGCVVVLDDRAAAHLPTPWPGLSRARATGSEPEEWLWRIFVPIGQATRNWWRRQVAWLEWWTEAATLPAYRSLAGDAAAGLVCGLVADRTSRRESCQLVCGPGSERVFDLDSGGESFEAAWEFLAELLFAGARTVEPLEKRLATLLEAGPREIWLVTCRPDEESQGLVARLREAGHTVRPLAISVQGARAPDGFTAVAVEAVAGGVVHVE
jgi:hypothetical protein